MSAVGCFSSQPAIRSGPAVSQKVTPRSTPFIFKPREPCEWLHRNSRLPGSLRIQSARNPHLPLNRHNHPEACFQLLGIGSSHRKNVHNLIIPYHSIRVVGNGASAGSAVDVSIELVSLGNEIAFGFSLTFDLRKLCHPQGAFANKTATTPHREPAILSKKRKADRSPIFPGTHGRRCAGGFRSGLAGSDPSRSEVPGGYDGYRKRCEPREGAGSLGWFG